MAWEDPTREELRAEAEDDFRREIERPLLREIDGLKEQLDELKDRVEELHGEVQTARESNVGDLLERDDLDEATRVAIEWFVAIVRAHSPTTITTREQAEPAVRWLLESVRW